MPQMSLVCRTRKVEYITKDHIAMHTAGLCKGKHECSVCGDMHIEVLKRRADLATDKQLQAVYYLKQLYPLTTLKQCVAMWPLVTL